MELIVNSDSIDRQGDILDMEVSNLANVNKADIQKWRNFYARTKHTNKKDAQLQTYLDGEKSDGDSSSYKKNLYNYNVVKIKTLYNYIFIKNSI